MTLAAWVCAIFGHIDDEYQDVEAPYPDATYRVCRRCGREDPPPW